MQQTTSPRSTRRRRAPSGIALLAIAAVVATIGAQAGGAPTTTALEPVPPATPAIRDADDSGHGLTEEDGVLPAGVTPFDDDHAGIANLDPALLDALRAAATAARDDGIEVFVGSGWRSAAYQARLLADAIDEYGSTSAAARWVATPETSPHVAGDAVDIAAGGGVAWLVDHGARYGLCRIYRNEPWHFELRPTGLGRDCPRMYRDPSHDPRLQP